MYLTLRAENTGVVEDVILQHSDMAALHPESLNTLRVVTVLNGEGPHIVYAYIRIGNGGRSVDNLHAGGMYAPIEFGNRKDQISSL